MIVPDLLGKDFDSAMNLLSEFRELQVVVKETKSPKNKHHHITRSKRVINQNLNNNILTLIVAEI